ncbi:ester cyclase [Mycolicibacterium thermoresistibile]
MDPKALYRRWIDELWNGQPVAATLVADDFVGHWPNRDVHGPDELQSVIDQTHTMFSELRFTIEVGPLLDGDLLAGRWVGAGRSDDGPVRFVGNDILRIADGRFVEYWTGTATA